MAKRKKTFSYEDKLLYHSGKHRVSSSFVKKAKLTEEEEEKRKLVYTGPRWHKKKETTSIPISKKKVIHKKPNYKVKYIDNVRHVIQSIYRYDEEQILLPKKQWKSDWVEVKRKRTKRRKNKDPKTIFKKIPTYKTITKTSVLKEWIPEEYKGKLVYLENISYIETGKVINRGQNKHALHYVPLIEKVIKVKNNNKLYSNKDEKLGKTDFRLVITPKTRELKDPIQEPQYKKQITLIPTYKKKSHTPNKDASFSARKAEQNETKQKSQRMICIKEVNGNKVIRVKYETGENLAKSGDWHFTSKSSYKHYKNNLMPKTGLNENSLITRKAKRFKPPKKGKGLPGARIQTVYSDIDGKTIKHKNVNNKLTVLDDNGKPKKRTVTHNTVVPVYVEDPVYKNIWELNENGTVKMKKVGNKFKTILKEKVPVVKTITDKNGHFVEKVALTKRVFKELENVQYKVTCNIRAFRKTITTRGYTYLDTLSNVIS